MEDVRLRSLLNHSLGGWQKIKINTKGDPLSLFGFGPCRHATCFIACLLRGQWQRQPVLVTPDGTSKLTFLDSPPVGAVAKTRSNEDMESDAPYSNIDELLRSIAENS